MESQLELTEDTVDPCVQNYITLNNLPLFFPSKKEHVQEIIDHHGLTHFYILAGDTYYDETDKKTYDNGLRLFMVINNVLGVCVNPVENTHDAPIVDKGIQLRLPKIPRQMIATIDALFREVDKRNGTETIAILTYDTAKEGPEGWGYLIPQQSNSPAHCKYEPESLIEMWPNDTTFQVGTAHSHPDMPSYKSGTDQADQLEAGDGIHMTLGWQKHKNNNATEFYIEVQFGQLQQRVTEAYVFEDYSYEIDEDEIEAHISKVTKEYSSSQYTPSAGSSSSPGYGSPSAYNYTPNGAKSQLINLPDDAPDPKEAVIILPTYTNTTSDKYHCHGCDSELVAMEIRKRSCLVCKMPVSIDGESLQEIIEARKTNKTSWSELDIDKNPSLPVWIWDKVPADTDSQNLIDVVYPMYEPDGTTGK